MSSNDSTYNRRIARALDELYSKRHLRASTRREIKDLKLIVFSDHHRGQRDRADDFVKCEQAYIEALQHYDAEGYELFLLGDVEELWENQIHEPIEAYREVLELERRFARNNRFMRFVGNHDDTWYNWRTARRHLGPYLERHRPEEALVMTLIDGDAELGDLFMLHGHQGTTWSDTRSWVSRFLVRYLWRPAQRMFDFGRSTPSTNYDLRETHELAMSAWADGKQGVALVAGHTHHPVWCAQSLEEAVQKSSAGRELARELEWSERNVGDGVDLDRMKPCYFNTGCCSFSDGSITGIEMVGGEIRLVGWGRTTDPIRREVILYGELREILKRLR